MEYFVGLFLVLPVCNAFVVTHLTDSANALVTNVSTATGSHCLTCEDISQPRHCPYVTKCEPEEFCSTEKFITRNGDTRYNVGCKSRHICEQYRTGRSLGKSYTLCLECSSGDLSNADGCGAPGYPSDLGPVCMACSKVQNPTFCNKVEVCGESQVCHVQETIQFGDSIYTSSCLPKHECGPLLNNGFGKKRDTAPALHHNERNILCSQCCTGNLCNLQCGKTQSQTTTRVVIPTGPTVFVIPTIPTTHRTPFVVPTSPPTPFVIPTVPTTSTDPCRLYNCGNGTCMKDQGIPRCVCPSGWTGNHCEIDPCGSSACRGTCSYDSLGQVACVCNYTWTWPNCDVQCDKGYTYNVAPQMCYKVVITGTDWKTANDRCKADYGRLLTLDTQAKRTFMSNQLFVNTANVQSSSHVFWIGGTDNVTEGDWRWLDNTHVVTTQPPWNPNQPNNILNSQGVGQNCLVFESTDFSSRRAYGLGDGYCTDTFKYICEKIRNTINK